MIYYILILKRATNLNYGQRINNEEDFFNKRIQKKREMK